MNRNGEIIIIEDDQDDRDFLKDIFNEIELQNKIVFFEDPTQVVDYLMQSNVSPFLLLCDINMPKIDGFELRRRILNEVDLQQKFIPFIFLTTSESPENIQRAFTLSANGYFKKESDFRILKNVIENIVLYWKNSKKPLFI